jgi:hypothetical protein
VIVGLVEPNVKKVIGTAANLPPEEKAIDGGKEILG